MSVAEFNRNLRKHFPGCPYCLDHALVYAHGQPWTAHLDIIKLDNWITGRHGAYEGSMQDRVRVLFGEVAVAFIIDAIGPKE